MTGTKMMGFVYQGPGVPAELRELPKPEAGPGEVVVRVGANTVCGTDLRILRGEKTKGVALGVVLGHEVAGHVTQTGEGVDDFAVAPDGTIFAATHAEGIARLAPGAATPVLIPAPGLEGSTAVALARDRRSLFALGTGGVLDGGRGEAVLARMTL